MKVIFVCVWVIIIYTCIINVCQIDLSSFQENIKIHCFILIVKLKNKQPFENMWSKYIKDNFYLYIACFWIKNSNFGRFAFQICHTQKKKEKHIKIDDKHVLCSCKQHIMHKKKRKKKQITFHIKSRFVDNFISENKVHVCKHFIFIFFFITHLS